MISVEDARQRIPDGKQLYNALVRNQRLMPPRKDAINTQKFLRGVWTKKYWVMSSPEVVGYKMCADPPSKKQLARILSAVMANYRSLGEPTDSGIRRTAKQIRKRPPSTNWMLLVLSNLDPANPVFAKSYVAPKKPKGNEAVFLENQDDFFDGLPVASTKKKRFINLLDGKAKKAQQHAKTKARMAKMQAKLDAQQAAMNESSDSSSDDSDSDSSSSVQQSANAQSQAANYAANQEEEKQPVQTMIDTRGTDGANIIGNAGEMDNEMSMPLIDTLQLDGAKSSMKTRSCYKGNVFVNAGVKKTTDMM